MHILNADNRRSEFIFHNKLLFYYGVGVKRKLRINLLGFFSSVRFIKRKEKNKRFSDVYKFMRVGVGQRLRSEEMTR